MTGGKRRIGYIASRDAILVSLADTSKGTVEILSEVECASPSYLALSPDGKNLYAVCVSKETAASRNGAAAAYSIAGDGTLELINQCASCSTGPACHVSVSGDGKFVYACDYYDGRAMVYARESDGALFGPVQVLQNRGCGPHPQQNTAHVHCASDTPEGKYVCVVDLALDAIDVYRRLENGDLEKARRARTALGAGARHIAFSPDGRFAYVICEMAASVSAYAYSDGRFDYIGETPLESAGYDGPQSGSGIRVSRDGALVFAGNRFADQITVFSRDALSGLLTTLSRTDCAFPRDIALSPDGECLYVCAGDKNIVQTFKVNEETGELVKTCEIPVPGASCAVFL